MDQKIPSPNGVLLTNMDCGLDRGCGYAITGMLLMPYENNVLLMHVEISSSEIEFLKPKQGYLRVQQFYIELFCTYD